MVKDKRTAPESVFSSGDGGGSNDNNTGHTSETANAARRARNLRAPFSEGIAAYEVFAARRDQMLEMGFQPPASA